MCIIYLATGTFFVNHEWTDYWLTNALYVKGHEIASHTITRESMPAFQKADLDRYVFHVELYFRKDKIRMQLNAIGA